MGSEQRKHVFEFENQTFTFSREEALTEIVGLVRSLVKVGSSTETDTKIAKAAMECMSIAEKNGLNVGMTILMIGSMCKMIHKSSEGLDPDLCSALLSIVVRGSVVANIPNGDQHVH